MRGSDLIRQATAKRLPPRHHSAYPIADNRDGKMCRCMRGGCIASSFQNDLLARLGPIARRPRAEVKAVHATWHNITCTTSNTPRLGFFAKAEVIGPGFWRILFQMFRSAKLLHDSCSRLNRRWRTVQKNPPAIPISAISGACMRTRRGNNYSVMHVDLLTVGKRLTGRSVKAYSNGCRCRSGWRF